MRVIAVQHFHPPGLPRPIRVGEVLDAENELAREWLGAGLVRMEEPNEKMIREPAEKAIRTPAEKAIRKPRENAGRGKR